MTARTTTQRGLGYRHQVQRKRLLAGHVDGSPCWWCKRPMYREARANFDAAPLEADHSIARSKGGTVADRLLHRRCNRARQSGDNDHLRPSAESVSGRVTPIPTRDWFNPG